MNVEDLKKLKEELEEKGEYIKQVKFVKVPEFGCFEDCNTDETMSYSEILSQENTDDYVKQLELYLEKMIGFLVTNGVPFDHIYLESSLGLFCTKEFFDYYKEGICKNLDYCTEDDIPYLSQRDILKTQILPEIVPVSFRLSIDTGCSGSVYGAIQNPFLNKLFDSDSSSKDVLKEVSGIVNWEKFVSKLEKLGYNVEIGNCDGVTFNDYIETAAHYLDDTFIEITTDLSKTKESNSHKM